MQTDRGQSPPTTAAGRARSYSRAWAAAPDATDGGYCRLFSTDWWIICLSVLSLLLPLATLGVVLYLSACTWITVRNPGLAWRTLVRCWPLLLLPALCILSTLWSDDPSVSMKQSVELAATIVSAIVIFRRTDGRGLAAALLLATFLVCLLSLLYQRSALSAPLVGLMGSKNQMGFLSQVLIGSATAVLADKKNSIRLRLFALAGVLLGLGDVVLARSAGAWLTTAAAFLAFVVLSFFSRISFSVRALLVVLLVLVLAPLAFAFQDITQAAQTFQTQTLHKDSTLTGRTELWTAASSVIAESPIIGHGYNAFWQQGNLDAEGLYRANGIGSRYGFNFHNQFLDAQVDLGEIGLCVLIGTLIYVGGGSMWRATISPTLSGAFMASILVALYSRLPIESTLIGQWNLYTTLWIAIGVSAFAPGDLASRAGSSSSAQATHAKTSLRIRRGRLRRLPEPTP